MTGVYNLGLTLGIGFAIVVAGVSVSVLKVYRPQLWIAWSVYIAGMGAYTTFRFDTPLAITLGTPIVTGVGAGALYGTPVPLWNIRSTPC